MLKDYRLAAHYSKEPGAKMTEYAKGCVSIAIFVKIMQC